MQDVRKRVIRMGRDVGPSRVTSECLHARVESALNHDGESRLMSWAQVILFASVHEVSAVGDCR